MVFRYMIYITAVACCSVFSFCWLCYLWSGSTRRIPRHPSLWWATYWRRMLCFCHICV